MRKVKSSHSQPTSSNESDPVESTEEKDNEPCKPDRCDDDSKPVEEKECVDNEEDVSMKRLESYDTITGEDPVADTEHSGISGDMITS